MRIANPLVRLLVFQLAFLGAATARAAILIDSFAQTQGPVTLVTAPNSVTTVASDSGAGTILQSERNVRVSGSSVAGGPITATVSSNVLTFSRPAGSVGEGDFWWDGANGVSFSGTGLGGVDLTAGGNTGFSITSVSSSSTTLRMQLAVYSGSDASRKFFTLPAGAGTVELPFAEFEAFGGGGANFAAVGAIYLYTADNTGAWTLTLTTLEVKKVSRIFNDGFDVSGVCLWSATIGGPFC